MTDHPRLPFEKTDDRTDMFRAIDTLFSKIDFETEAETVELDNITQTKQAFREFLAEMNWKLGKVSFDELMDEKSGDFAMRDDGITPSWYHEFSEIMVFLALVKSGKISDDVLSSGGAEVIVSSFLRHDSWEDHGKTPHDIYAELERDLYEELGVFEPPSEREHETRKRAAAVSNVVDLATRKVPVRGTDYFGLYGKAPDHGVDDQGFVLKANGRRLKVDRYDGDLNSYHQKQMQHPYASIVKMIDSICGLDSRIMPDYLDRKDDDQAKFSTASNIVYARERRSHYSNYAKGAIAQNPQFREAFEALDAILGIGVRTLETVNHYFHRDNKDNPYIAQPVDIDDYVEPARDVLEVLPKGWRPDTLILERLENIAKQELEQNKPPPMNTPLGHQEKKHYKWPRSIADAVLNHALYPAFVPLIGKDRRAADVIEYEKSRRGDPDGQTPG